MTKEFEQDYQNYLDKWGLEVQMQMAIEEMSELTKELCKYIRYSTFESENQDKIKLVVENIKGEIADVLNMTEQLESYFGEKEIYEIRKQKIARTNLLLTEEN